MLQYVLNIIYTYQSVCIMILCGHDRDSNMCIHNSSKRFPDHHFALASCPHVVLLINLLQVLTLTKGSHNPRMLQKGNRGLSESRSYLVGGFNPFEKY